MSYLALLFCPDERTARVLTQVLSELAFSVEPCNEPFAAVKKLAAQRYDAVVVDCENEQNAALLFKTARNSGSNQGSLSVAVVEGQAGVANAFRIGANLVLTKPINMEQAKGTLRVARGLLRKGADAPKPAASAPEPPSPPAPGLAFGPTPTKISAPTFQPPARVPAPVPSMQAPAPSGMFDVESDPTPAPEPAEAALLESMDKPVVTRPLGLPKPAPVAAAPAALGLSFSSSSPTISSAGQAAAPAPAKTPALRTPAEPISAAPPAPSAPLQDLVSDTRHSSTPEPAIFAGYTEPANESAGGSKKPFIILVLAAALAVAAYLGYTRMHKTGTASAPSAAAIPAPAVAPALSPAPAAATPDPSLTTDAPSTTAPAAPQSQPDAAPLPESNTSAPAKPVTPSRIVIDVAETPAPKSAPPAKAPLVVKSNSAQTARPEPPADETVQPPAPGMLAVAANNADSRALSGIVSSTAVSVPRPAPQMYRISQGVSEGMITRRVQPVYPPQAFQMRVQGAVEMEAVISKTGSIANVKVLRGDAVLARAAVNAVRQWKYKPYYLNGEPVEVQTQITVNFKLP